MPEIIRLHDAPVLDLPGVPTDLTAVLRRSLAKDPAQRYPDAAGFRDDLARLGGSVGPVSVTGPVRTRPSRRPVLLAGAALAAALILLAVWYVMVRDRGDGASNPTQAASTAVDLGVRTIEDPCPATRADGQVRCTERAECWSGPVLINGEVTSIRRLPCDQEHSWETFAIAPVPPEIGSPYADVLEANPRVAKVCAIETLLASRLPSVTADQWQVTALPPTPDDRAAGRSVYRCLGTLAEGDLTGPVFRPAG